MVLFLTPAKIGHAVPVCYQTPGVWQWKVAEMTPPKKTSSWWKVRKQWQMCEVYVSSTTRYLARPPHFFSISCNCSPKKAKMKEAVYKYIDSIYTENTTECFMQIHICICPSPCGPGSDPHLEGDRWHLSQKCGVGSAALSWSQSLGCAEMVWGPWLSGSSNQSGAPCDPRRLVATMPQKFVVPWKHHFCSMKFFWILQLRSTLCGHVAHDEWAWCL